MSQHEWLVLYFFLGSFVGFMTGLLGVGGGGIFIPFLTSIFVAQGVEASHVVHLALGTSLACMIVSSSASMRAHQLRNTVVWEIAWGMAPGILLGAFVTTHFAIHIDSTYIGLFFVFFMTLTAAQMFLNWWPRVSTAPVSFYGLFFMGILIGSISSLAAVGGGFLTVLYLSHKNIDMKKAVGTSAAIGLPTAIAGTAGYMINGWTKTLSIPHTIGFIYVPAFLIISSASILTAPYGAHYSQTLPESRLKKIFAVLCLFLSAKMLWQLVAAHEATY